MPVEHLVGFIDRGAGGDECVDDLDSLVVGGHDQSPETALSGVSAVSHRRCHRPRPSSIERTRAPAATSTSTTSVIPKTAACNSADPPGTPPESADAVASIGTSSDQYGGDGGVAIAGGCYQWRLGGAWTRRPVRRRRSGPGPWHKRRQHRARCWSGCHNAPSPRNRAAKRPWGGQASALYRPWPAPGARRSKQPTPRRRGGRGRAGGHFELDGRPAGEPVVARQAELGGGQGEPGADLTDPVAPAPASPVRAARSRSLAIRRN